MTSEFDRRGMVRMATGLVAVGGMAGVVAHGGLISGAVAGTDDHKDEDHDEKQMEEVTPPEDLMREHGVLDRVLLIYEATMRKFADNESFDVSIISSSAQIVRQFVEDYHERNEENFVFPRFEQAGRLTGLVHVLYQQHQAGRRVTDTIMQLAPSSAAPGDDRTRLIAAMRAFIRMYRPHEAREDTVLFPALRSVVTGHEFDSMAEDFEKDEQRKFGEDGFQKVVGRVAELERAIGIYDLSKFTPA